MLVLIAICCLFSTALAWPTAVRSGVHRTLSRVGLKRTNFATEKEELDALEKLAAKDREVWKQALADKLQVSSYIASIWLKLL